MGEANDKSQVTAEAPPDVAQKLKQFGVEWKSNALAITGTNADLPLDDNTASVSFNAGRTNVEITAHNKDGTENVILVSNGSIKIDGEELKLQFNGKPCTLGEIQDSINGNSARENQDAASSDIDREMGKLVVKSLMRMYESKGLVSQQTMFKILSGNQIAVSKPVRGEDPVFEYKNGEFVPVNYKGSYQPMSPPQFEEFIKKGPHRNDPS